VQPLFDVGDLFGRTIAADDNLLLGIVQGVEGVEKLLLCPVLAGQELNVIHQQDVDVPVPFAKQQHLVVADTIDQLIHEPLGGHVDQLGLGSFQQDIVADRVHQVRLTQPDTAIDVQRVVGRGRLFRHSHRGGVGELVAGADDKRIEAILGIQPHLTQQRLRLLARGQRLLRAQIAVGCRVVVHQESDAVAVEIQ